MRWLTLVRSLLPLCYWGLVLSHRHNKSCYTRGIHDMTNGQRAYEAYTAHQGNKSHDGKPLPAWSAVSTENQAAWEAFGYSAYYAGFDVRRCYETAYLPAMKGKTVSGGPAPAWAYFEHNRPDIVGAWTAAHAAVMP